MIAATGGLIAREAFASALARMEKLDVFHPGQTWLDTAGKPIQAHGASLICVGDTFYWYGENKEFTTGSNDIWTWGIRFYASKDLYNWDDLGIIIPQTKDDTNSPFYYKYKWDRPHIVFNAATRKFVCWIKNLSVDQPQTRIVLTADTITGPYTVSRANLALLGMSAGDFDLAVNLEDGKAYQYFERIHSEMICADLTDDYTSLTGYYTTHLAQPTVGLVREAPAHFVRKGKHYLITSGTTGYHPNPSEVAIADTFHGPWTTLGNLHPDDKSLTSFNSQVSTVFKVPFKQDLYIAIADRWNSNLERIAGSMYANGEAYHLFLDAVRKAYVDGHILPLSELVKVLTPAQLAYVNATGLDKVNTSLSTYVWLPLQFDGDRPFIRWRDTWSLSEFE